MHVDVLLTTLPPNYLHEPTLAPAILKSALQANGFSCKTVDFAFCCYNTLFKNDYDRYLKWQSTLINEYDYAQTSKEHLDLTNQAIDQYIQLIEQYQPKFLALSIFSYWVKRN
jgi:Fe-S cluster biosynthesis and repair protein YggX